MALYHRQNRIASEGRIFCAAITARTGIFPAQLRCLALKSVSLFVYGAFLRDCLCRFKTIYVFCLIPERNNKPQSFQLPGAFHAGGNQINACGFNAGTAQKGPRNGGGVWHIQGPGTGKALYTNGLRNSSFLCPVGRHNGSPGALWGYVDSELY